LKEWLIVLGEWLSWLATHKVVLLLVGGGVGTNARYWLARWVGSQRWGQEFPYGTLIINVSGSFILGAAAIVLRDRMPNWFLLVGTGFCGGYTTFSTFEYESYALVDNRSLAAAFANVVGSVLLGFVAVALAVRLARNAFPAE
jgi:CrcB protein